MQRNEFLYRSAFYYLLMPEDQNFRLKTQWKWSMEGMATKPAIVIDWSIKHRRTGNGFHFSASGPTFESTLIRLAAKFAASEEAKESHMAFSDRSLRLLHQMDKLANYGIVIEAVEAKRVVLAAYTENERRIGAIGRTFEEAEEALISSLKGSRTHRLENPQRFYSQWSYMEKHLGDPWKSGKCLMMVAEVNPITGSVNPDVPAANTEIRTFLFDPGSRGTSVSAVSFEEALNRFARSLGWKP